jgi:hypothetical protein
MADVPALPTVLLITGGYLTWFGIHYFRSDVAWPSTPVKAVLTGNKLPANAPSEPSAHALLSADVQALQPDPAAAAGGTGATTPGPTPSGTQALPLGDLGNVGGTAAANKAIMQKVAASFGWTGAEWDALDYVEMREAGYSLTAKNPTSGAYGMAQFINGPSEYAQYGGNSTSAFGQATGMCNYIKQRYGTPSAAMAHEKNMNWY